MEDKNSTEIVSACGQYLSSNGGKCLTLLLDGYDEYPEHLRESSLIANILKCFTSLWIGCIIPSTCLRTSPTEGNHQNKIKEDCLPSSSGAKICLISFVALLVSKTS